MAKKETAGIITEYNPFHAGHKWMVQQLKNSGVQTVVCVMSSQYVQRAEPALFPVDVRVKAAIASGADLILRLPVPWAIQSAEGFGLAGAGMLAALGCVDLLAFGAETPEIEKLQSVADFLGTPAFETEIKQQLATGESFAAARQKALEKVAPGGGELLASPNNILGIEYCKALNRLQKENLLGPLPAYPQPVAIARQGAEHDGMPVGEYASASWLRGQFFEGNIMNLEKWVPKEAFPFYKAAVENGRVLDKTRWEIAMLSRLKGMSAQEIAFFAGDAEGLENRMAQQIENAASLQQLYDGVKTKRYAHSRIRRMALAASLGIPLKISPLVPFLHVLGASQNGLELLKKAKETAVLPLSTSLAQLSRHSEAAQQAATLEAKAESLYLHCLQSPAAGGEAYKNPFYIKE